MLNRPTLARAAAALAVPAFLACAALALYGAFLSNPLVFDDHWFFEHLSADLLSAATGTRWLPYVSIYLTAIAVEDSMAWLRLENLALHVANACLLFVFLRRLFETVAPDSGMTSASSSALSLPGLALAGALLFLVHPAAVYGVAYLVQRTILMATMFALLTWILFLKGLATRKQRWLLASAVAYLFAAFSKEHAIMAPAVSLALCFLAGDMRGHSVRLVAPTFALYAPIALLTTTRISRVLATAYEPFASTLTGDIDPDRLYPLSVLTQGYLFFKYLLLWLVPLTSQMSVDIREPLAKAFWTWPQTVGAAAFVLLPIVAGRLLLRKGRTALAGFALLCPWLLFATELATVRLQESFVLYRSYLWMPCLAAVLPLLLRAVPARLGVALIAVAALALGTLSWGRLVTFSEPLLLWDEALQLARKRENTDGIARIYHNRGVAYLDLGRYREAIADLDAAIGHMPDYSPLYNDRAVAYLQLGRYREALRDYESAIWLAPGYYNPYLGRAKVYEALGDMDAARRDYVHSCWLGVTEVCDKH